MRPVVLSHTTTCLPFAVWCGVRLQETIDFRRWLNLWFTANNSKRAVCLNLPCRKQQSNFYDPNAYSNFQVAKSGRIEMIITRKHISRRAVLKGMGVGIALPLLDAMNPAATLWAQTAAGKTPPRFAFVGFPHGAVMDRWSPKTAGTDYEMSAILEPLAPYRQHMTIVSGLRNKPGESPEPHANIEPTWLNCVKPGEHGLAGPDAGVTADQLAARYIGQDTRLPSLELTTTGSARLSWRTPTQSLPQEGNPRAVFQKLFGQGDTDKERATILVETGSILDRVKAQAARLNASLGVNDRVVVSDYLDSVREIERRVQMAEKQDM